MKVHLAIAKALVDQGVETLFGVMGDANLFMIDSFVRECGGKYVSAAHEAGAALMALGYSTVSSGKLGVASVTHGPGLTNALTALVDGVKGSNPFVLLCGDTEDRENFQRIFQREFIVATGAGFEQLRSPQTLAEDIATVFRRATIERRPIVFNIPAEFQWLDVEYTKIEKKISTNRAVVPSSPEFDAAVGIIATAKRPLIVAGIGAGDPASREAILRLARRIDAPVATTLRGKDLFRGEDRNIGILGTLSSPVAADIGMEADCIIGLGASLNMWTMSRGAFLKGKRIVQINLQQSEVGRTVNPDAGVVGDPALVADAIIHWLDEIETAPSGFFNEEMHQKLKAYPAGLPLADTNSNAPIEFESALRSLNQAIPANRLLVHDGGRFLATSWKHIDATDPRSLVFASNFGSIGLGMSQAIGAASTPAKRPVLLMTGDGGFMLSGITEFNTAVRCQADLIVVVCNDGAYGAEHVQFRNRGLDPSLTTFDWPDLAPIAISLGGHGITVRTGQDLAKALHAIETRDRPLLIDLKLDPEVIPPLF